MAIVNIPAGGLSNFQTSLSLEQNILLRYNIFTVYKKFTLQEFTNGSFYLSAPTTKNFLLLGLSLSANGAEIDFTFNFEPTITTLGNELIIRTENNLNPLIPEAKVYDETSVFSDTGVEVDRFYFPGAQTQGKSSTGGIATGDFFRINPPNQSFGLIIRNNDSSGEQNIYLRLSWAELTDEETTGLGFVKTI